MKFRVFERGFRRIAGDGMCSGVIVRCGSIVEKFDETKQIWLYVDCVHPDDTIKITKDHEVRKMQEQV